MKVNTGHMNSVQDQAIQSKAKNQADSGIILQAYKKGIAQSVSHGETANSSEGVIQRRVITRSLSRIFAETRLETEDDFQSLIAFLSKSGFEKREFDGIVNRILNGEFKPSEEKVEDADEEIINWTDHGDLMDYDDPKGVDQYIEGNNVAQLARKPGVISGPKSYGAYKDVAYKTDDKGCIDFENTHGNPTQWSNPVEPNSEVDLRNSNQQIDTKNRAQHFAIGDFLLAKRRNKSKASDITNHRKSTWTWHHLKDPYKMVLVDMLVHAKHGHNGGVHIW